MFTLFVLELISAFILAATLLWRYGDCYRNHIIVTLSVLTAWYFSFVIMFILPLDISSTVYHECQRKNEPNGTTTSAPAPHNTSITTSTVAPTSKCYAPWDYDYVFPNLWRVLYWTSQCLTWLIMPMMQSYSKAGDFTVKTKLKSALVDNAIYYGSYLFICGILLIYIAFKSTATLNGIMIKSIASSASNTWGLFLLILLLGYALVEVPRNLWNNSKKNYTLTHCYFKMAKLSSDKFEAEENMDDILDSLQAMSVSVSSGHPLHRHVDTIIQKLPVQLRDKMATRQVSERSPPPSLKSLVNLHKKTIKALQVLQRTETQYGIMVERAFHLEDVAASMRAPDQRFQHTFPRARSKLTRLLYTPTVEWYWECATRPYFLRALAVLTGVLSAAVVWSELTFFCKRPVLSVFANILNACKESQSYGVIVTMSTLVIAYMFYCAYSTVLKIRLLNLYYLAPHHQTNEYSLIFSGMMVCRLTPAMCLNFLGLVHMDTHVLKEQFAETYYTQIMGHMDLLGIIAEGFNIYFPMLVALLCAATWLSLGSRLLSLCGWQQFVGDDELTTDLVDEGREIIKREKRKRQRAEESVSRRRDFNDRFSTYRSTRGEQDGAHVGLLTDVDTDYYVRAAPNRTGYSDAAAGYQAAEPDFNRAKLSLEDEIDRRFGDSTAASLHAGAAHDRHTTTAPPRNLFDDV